MFDNRFIISAEKMMIRLVSAGNKWTNIIFSICVCVWGGPSGDVPAEDPHHGSVQRVDAQEVSVQSSVGFSAAAVLWSRHRAGTSPHLFRKLFQCPHTIDCI